jgi:hypothetical protein
MFPKLEPLNEDIIQCIAICRSASAPWCGTGETVLVKDFSDGPGALAKARRAVAPFPLFTCVHGAPHGHVGHALPGRETLNGVPLDGRRARAYARGSPCESRNDDRRVRRNDPARGTKVRPR